MQLNPAKWDQELMIFLNNLSPDAFNSFWVLVTHTKHWIPFYIFLLALFFVKSKWKSGLFGNFVLLINVAVIHLVTELTKFYVQRLRPNFAENISSSLKILYEPHNFSFFSGHASTSFGATVFVYLCLKSRFKYLGWIFIWPILFSLSRIFVGVHYPSDIIVGAFVGTILAILMSKIYFKFQPKFSLNK